MSDYDGGFSNHADGSCQTCGEDTEEPWHAFCARCYAEEQGWTSPARTEAAPLPPGVVAAIGLLREELAELRARLDRLEKRAA
jgi:hypothetical protein